MCSSMVVKYTNHERKANRLFLGYNLFIVGLVDMA